MTLGHLEQTRQYDCAPVHDVLRCPKSAWNLPATHALQVRAAVLVSAEIFSPCPHFVCGMHEVWRWSVPLWYVSTSHALQVRAAVLVSSEIFLPIPHIVCVVHDV